MTFCIQYARPQSGLNDSEVFGLDIAVNNFLTAYFRHGAAQQFICRPVDLPSFEHFRETARACGIDENRCIGLDPRRPKENLESISCLFRPDALISDLIWKRQQLRGRGYAACGLVHTMSGERIARAVGELCIAPSQETDALICPSNAVRDAVKNLWEIYSEYLNYHFGGSYRCPVQLPVIPLGVDCEKFARLTTPAKRNDQRKALGVTPDEIVILFVGRLSFATKMHPLALWQAAERAAHQTKRKLRLVMFGYFKPKDMEPHFRGLAAAIAKKAAIEFVMNDDPRFPDGLWAGADIFASLSDNVQESFGLTPIEAMASGLPAVISDWDGYRGGVRDGEDGFLIPTLTPPPQAGFDIAEQYYNEQNYGVKLTGSSQSTVVDINRCAETFRLLAEDDAKRRAMGQNSLSRARDTFDWRHIVKAYENLWHDLAQKRQAAAPKMLVPKNWPAVHPSFVNPWKMFESFPSRHLAPADRLRVVMDREEIAALAKYEINFFVPELLMPKETLLTLVEIIRKAGGQTAHEIVSPFPAHEQARVWRCIGWMLKLGICELETKNS